MSRHGDERQNGKEQTKRGIIHIRFFPVLRWRSNAIFSSTLFASARANIFICSRRVEHEIESQEKYEIYIVLQMNLIRYIIAFGC